MYEARNSIYCYPNSNILINKLNIKDAKALSDYEKRIVSLKLVALNKQGITGNFDVTHFVSIHKFLFEDIYPFAGAFRLENIAKDNFSFAQFEYIESELTRLFNKLKDENYLSCANKSDNNTHVNSQEYKKYLSNKLAYYWAELNVLHPFREGNGRTTREFLRQLALKNNYHLDIQNVDATDLLEASKKSVIDESDLSKLIYESLEEIK